MKTRFLYPMLALIIAFSACNDYMTIDQAIVDEVKSEAASGAVVSRAPGGDLFTWNGASDKAVAFVIGEDLIAISERVNSSNNPVKSIPSNAHSDDYPGIYFRWDVKQKDVGYLKVHESVFESYEGFILTAQESNIYWDFTIILQEGQEKTEDGCYVFCISKLIEKFQLKKFNINQVWITYLGVPPPPAPDAGFLKIVKVFEGVPVEDIPEDWDATFTVTDADGLVILELSYKNDFVDGSYTIDLLAGEYTVLETRSDRIEDYLLESTVYVAEGGIATLTKNATDVVTVTNTYSPFPTVDVEVDATAIFGKTFNTITHEPVYFSAEGVVSWVNINQGRPVPVPDADKKAPADFKTLVYDLFPSLNVIGGYYSKPGGKDVNAFNGFTYIQFNVAKLKKDAPNGVDIELAKSNMSSGPMPMPNHAWNDYVGGSYNIKVVTNAKGKDEIVVTVNDFRSGNWDAILFEMNDKRPNNINSELKNWQLASKNLGEPKIDKDGNAFLFFKGNITTNKRIGCKVVSIVPGFNTVDPDDYEFVVTCEGALVMDNVVLFDKEGTFVVTVTIIDNEEKVLATNETTVVVTEEDGKLIADPEKIDIDFGRIVIGKDPDVVVCDWANCLSKK